MLQDRIKWNTKYQKGCQATEPSSIVRHFLPLASGRKALDIAAGNGRNAVYLAEQGYEVDAVDISEAGLALFAGTHSNINPICADLDRFDIPQEHYDLIINIKFLNRRLFPMIRDGLAKGGLLIFETFVDVPGEEAEQPCCRDYLLKENELLHAFSDLKILYYKEGNIPGETRKASIAALVGTKLT